MSGRRVQWDKRICDDEQVSCLCGWSGTGKDLSIDYFKELATRHCPECDATIEVAYF